jgi:hypothetical protein
MYNTIVLKQLLLNKRNDFVKCSTKLICPLNKITVAKKNTSKTFFLKFQDPLSKKLKKVKKKVLKYD